MLADADTQGIFISQWRTRSTLRLQTSTKAAAPPKLSNCPFPAMAKSTHLVILITISSCYSHMPPLQRISSNLLTTFWVTLLTGRKTDGQKDRHIFRLSVNITTANIGREWHWCNTQMLTNITATSQPCDISSLANTTQCTRKMTLLYKWMEQKLHLFCNRRSCRTVWLAGFVDSFTWCRTARFGSCSCWSYFCVIITIKHLGFRLCGAFDSLLVGTHRLLG